jgi:hypothetical protein
MVACPAPDKRRDHFDGQPLDKRTFIRDPDGHRRRET